MTVHKNINETIITFCGNESKQEAQLLQRLRAMRMTLNYKLSEVRVHLTKNATEYYSNSSSITTNDTPTYA